MSWFVTEEDIRHFDGFMQTRSKATGINTNDPTIRQLCRLILTNKPNYDTCSNVCHTYECSEKTSDYCRIKTNSKNKYDWVDWRVQAWRFQKEINHKKEILVKLLGEKRINYFIAPIVQMGIEDIQSLSRTEREKFLSQWVPNITQVDEDIITIADVENDYWFLYVQSQTKKEENLLCF